MGEFREHGGSGMKSALRVTVLLGVLLLLASAVQAGPTLIAIGSVSGTYEDLALETAPPLENGGPGNRLGGPGPGPAYPGGGPLPPFPRRGPTAQLSPRPLADARP